MENQNDTLDPDIKRSVKAALHAAHSKGSLPVVLQGSPPPPVRPNSSWQDLIDTRFQPAVIAIVVILGLVISTVTMLNKIESATKEKVQEIMELQLTKLKDSDESMGRNYKLHEDRIISLEKAINTNITQLSVIQQNISDLKDSIKELRSESHRRRDQSR